MQAVFALTKYSAGTNMRLNPAKNSGRNFTAEKKDGKE